MTLTPLYVALIVGGSAMLALPPHPLVERDSRSYKTRGKNILYMQTQTLLQYLLRNSQLTTIALLPVSVSRPPVKAEEAMCR